MKMRTLILSGMALVFSGLSSQTSWANSSNPFVSAQVTKAQVITALNWVNDASYRRHGYDRNQLPVNATDAMMYKAVVGLGLKEGEGSASLSSERLENYKGMAEVLNHALKHFRNAASPDIYDCYYASEKTLSATSSLSQMRSVLVGLLRVYQIIPMTSVTKADYNPENAARCDAGRKKALGGK